MKNFVVWYDETISHESIVQAKTLAAAKKKVIEVLGDHVVITNGYKLGPKQE